MSARLAGAIVGLLALICLAIVAFLTITDENLIKPEVSVAAVTGEGEASDLVAADALIARSNLLGDRKAPGETRGVTVDTGGRGSANLEFRDGAAAADETARSWLTVSDADAALLREAAFTQGSSSLPYANADVFEQPGGRVWRSWHNDQARYGGGWLIFGVIAALGLFLAARGRIKVAEGLSGETIQRFNIVERSNHWMTASAFVLLALTGLVLLYGKPLLIPLIGEAAFGDLAWASAWLHMASMVPFTLGLIVMIVLWLVDNLPSKLDKEWLKRGGGFMSDDGNNPPARKFNTGQKLVFWGVVLGGLAMLASGLVLMYPFLVFGYDGMQTAQIAHVVIALLMIALIFGHIYIGTIGMVDAFSAMWSGRVDRNWAKEHHVLWYEKVMARRERKTETG